MTPDAKRDAARWVQPQDTVVVFDQDECLDIPCSAQFLANFETQRPSAQHISAEQLAEKISLFQRVESW